MSRPVATPRRVFDSLAALADFLGCHDTALRAYLEEHGSGWRLVDLDEARYAAWHRLVWMRAQKEGRDAAVREPDSGGGR